jgi:hypothetical protein
MSAAPRTVSTRGPSARFASRCVGKCNALNDEAPCPCGVRRGDHIARALDADPRIARIGRRDLFGVEASRQVGELVNDDLGLRVDRGTRKRGRIINVDMRGSNARGLQIPSSLRGPRNTGDLVPRGDEKRNQSPADGSRCSGEKNAHVDLPVGFLRFWRAQERRRCLTHRRARRGEI